METRVLGATGLRVSALGFGAATLGGAYGPTSQSVADGAVRAALDAGINFFDTAAYYNDSEFVLGRALEGVARDSYVLCTKVGRYPDGVSDFSAKRVAESVDESLRRLKTDVLDVVYCHDIEFVPLELVLNEALPILKKAQADGKIRAVGVSGLPLALYDEVLAHTDLDVVLSYCHGCLADDSLKDRLPDWQARNLGIVSASPLSMGLLTDAGPHEWHPAPPELRASAARAASLCRERGESLARLAIAYSATFPGISTLLVGISNVDQVARNIDAAGAEIDPELLADVLEILAPTHRMSWHGGRFAA